MIRYMLYAWRLSIGTPLRWRLVALLGAVADWPNEKRNTKKLETMGIDRRHMYRDNENAALREHLESLTDKEDASS